MSFVGGKLKLKGGADLPGVKKKKKKKPAGAEAAVALAAKDEDAGDAAKAAEEAPAAGSGEGSSMPPPPPSADRRTEAEKRFEQHMLKYEEQRLKKAATKSHRERVKELNEKLSTMTEHHDIPRISYSYM